MNTIARNFFQFAGVHSLLIGLLPFFIPVLLLQRGNTIEAIALFIALTGLSFIFSLKLWEKVYQKANWRLITAASFMTEICLVAALLYIDGIQLLVLAALLNGAYNCFYWTTQRVLFSTMTTEPAQSSDSASDGQPSANHQTGRHYGNFQIMVVVLLKLGILISVFLLEGGYEFQLFVLSTVISGGAMLWFLRTSNTTTLATINETLSRSSSRHDSLTESATTSGSVQAQSHYQSIFKFKDNHNSAVVFYLDGVFLFLESYFWIISLYYITQENIKQLGLIVVLLTVFLSVIFFLLKNRIDAIDRNKIYVIAVVFYAASWLLRSMLDNSMPDYWIYPAILVIAFLTTFFRLSFNKRFFDNARQLRPLNYLLAKSYLSQTGIVIFFTLIALLASYFEDVQSALASTYLILTPIALIYLVYSVPKEAVNRSPTEEESRASVTAPPQNLQFSKTEN
ncbi:hypothetical protein [Amphritea japonica]|uniref:Uncharacterized protein n=1 Tax=Amphritea japonica ATCC BAA-1530 TaxID=1278309 RepID=A0A7R6SRL0_9GAMM|nr:hypothetical protein [Amphritea japonica]BBB25306.1 conserved hypothetical protein [Amphritea japonica ATCC BAA-1530]